MKFNGRKISVEFTPLQVSGAIATEGGPLLQFFDGVNYLPNRSGAPASPVVLSHVLDIIDPDGVLNEFSVETSYYENDVIISIGTEGYTILEDGSLRIEKNIPAGSAVMVKAKSEFLDPRTDKYYVREDFVTLRTILKTEAPYQLELSQRGRILFDGYRNPNTTTSVDILLRKGEYVVTDFTGLEFRWLNSDGKDAVTYEAYAPEYQNGKRTLLVDKTYINNETIRCEVWDGEVLLSSDSVTFVRHFNSIRTELSIPELPVMVGTTHLTCTVRIYDRLGEVNVDDAFLVGWFLQEGANDREVGTGARVQIPVSSINLKANPLQIYPDIKRRMAWAAIEDTDGYILTDVDDKVLTIETYSN